MKIHLDTTDAHRQLDELEQRAAKLTPAQAGPSAAADVEAVVDRKVTELLEQLTAVARGS